MPNRKFTPTEKQRIEVETLCGVGIPEEEIAKMIVNPNTGKPIDAKTLRKYFRRELDIGATKANAMVGQRLYKDAIDPDPKFIASRIFWARTRMRWKPATQVEVTGKDGEPLAPPVFNIGFVDPVDDTLGDDESRTEH